MDYQNLVSIIIPVYNSRKYLQRTIESILSQSYRNFELILVDDGSTDGSADICDQYSKIDERIRVIHKQNGGIVSARNCGLMHAKGLFICFCDDDDIFVEGLLEDNISILVEQNADAVKFNKIIKLVINDECKKCYSYNMRPGTYSRKDICDNISYLTFDDTYFSFIWDGIYRRELLVDSSAANEIQYFDPFYLNGYEDVDYNLRLIPRLNKIVFNKKPYYIHFITSDKSTSLKYSYNRVQSILKIFNTHNRVIGLLSKEERHHFYDIYSFRYESEIIISLLSLLSLKTCTISQADKVNVLNELRCNDVWEIHMNTQDKRKAIINFGGRYMLYELFLHKHFILLLKIASVKKNIVNKVFHRGLMK